MEVELHKKYDLRSRKRSRSQEQEGEQQVPTPLPKATPQEPQLAKQVNKGKKQQNTTSKSQILQGESSQDKSEKIPLGKLVSIPQDISVIKRGEDENEKNTKQGHVFSLTKELKKIRIQVPLTELVKTPVYQRDIVELVNLKENVNLNDTVNLQDDKLVVVFGPHMEQVDPSTPPFYISSLIHDFLLHNFMFD